MKHRKIFAFLAAAVAAMVPVLTARAQENMSSTPPAPTKEEMMARWREAATPGDAHKHLELFVGTWTVSAKSWMNGPDQPPEESKGKAVYEMVFGGRYLRQEFSGSMMEQPFNGVGYTGYDNFNKKYTSFWIDNSGTAMSTMEGNTDDDGKTIVLTGKMDDPVSGVRNKDVKYVLHVIDRNKHVFEVFDLTSVGDKNPVLQLTYTRSE